MYLIEILHQTTTWDIVRNYYACCILSKFYIKPQLCPEYCAFQPVVSYRNSTSNHNSIGDTSLPALLYLIEILHQTTTRAPMAHGPLRLYLIEILHQTTTFSNSSISFRRCILSKFYIKPQHAPRTEHAQHSCILSKFYIKPQQ